MEQLSWQPGDIYKAWDAIHQCLHDTMKALPRPSLAFLAERASDRIIRDKAAQALESLDALAGAGNDAPSTEDLRWQFRRVESE